MRITLNYTGRQTIPREDLKVYCYQRDGEDHPTFDLDVSFDSVSVPTDALVYVEAYYRTDRMRFELGTVDKLQIPEDRRLTEFDGLGAIQFRIKVVDANSKLGRILAYRERIDVRMGEKEDTNEDDSSGEDGDSESSGADGESSVQKTLLPVQYCDLDKEVWRLNLESQPVLEVNNQSSEVDIETLLQKDGRFLAMVYPEVFRRVLIQVLIVDSLPLDEIRDIGGWRWQWIKFAEQYNGDMPPDPIENVDWEEITRWIDGAVKRFCVQYDAYDRFVEGFSE